jgi:hypothetical protein
MNPVGQHMIPQQQFDMMNFMQQQQKMAIPQMPEAAKRPEVQAIVQGKQKISLSCRQPS